MMSEIGGVKMPEYFGQLVADGAAPPPAPAPGGEPPAPPRAP
jgi:hypothetical protein